MTRTLWEFDNVSLAGQGHLRLDDVSLTIREGVTAVIGPSGAGKSSLLNLLVDFERPTSGRIVARDTQHESVGGLPLFWVPQSDGLWSHLTVSDHLAVVSEDAAGNAWLLRQFDLLEKAAAYPDSLSAGQRGRLSLARGLASGAEVLVMDEPLANVDAMSARRYWSVIREYRQGKPLVFATHSIDAVLREADDVICLNHAKLLYAGVQQSLYESPPSAELAELLGPVNWFDQGESEQWLQGADGATQCYRPEHLKVESCDESPIEVRAARGGATVGELEVVDARSDTQRTVFHRMNGRRFQVGDRILLRVLLLFLMVCTAAICLPGCSASSDSPQLRTTGVSHWSMPSAGKVIPAPRSVRFGPDEEVFVLDNAGRVLVYASHGELLRQWEMPAYDVGKPEGICVFQDGRIAVTDTHYHRVVFFDREGNVLGMHGQHGREPGEFVYPVAITQDPDENYYICEYGDNDRVQKFSVDGTLLLTFGSFGTQPGQLQRPSGIVWDDHRLYVADAINNRIQVYTDTGEFEGVLSHEGRLPELYYPYDMILGREGQLFVVEYGAGRVTELSKTGEVLSRWGGIGSEKGKLNTPWGLAMNQDGKIVVADTGNRRLVEIQR